MKKQQQNHHARNSRFKVILPALALALLGWGFVPAAKGQINSQSDGSDGDLVVTNGLVIDLSKASVGPWNSGNGTNQGNGKYDPVNWAVVFNYNSVTISAGTVTFINHPNHAPVVWLVKSNVVINGKISLDGQDAVPAPALAEPGPGGFWSGMGGFAFGAGASAGMGPGGGWAWLRDGNGSLYVRGGGGLYGPQSNSGPYYGNPSLIPLIGGSGGGGQNSGASTYINLSHLNYSGGGGGGAILIACGQTLTINGIVECNGGSGSFGDYAVDSGGGSGGAIRLVADTLNGTGMLTCAGGKAGYADPGGVGRIRIETVNSILTVTNVVPGPSLLTLSPGATPPIFMPPTGPAVVLETINGQPVPADPFSGFGNRPADVILPQTSTLTLSALTTNVESGATVQFRLTPRANDNYTFVTVTNPPVAVSPDGSVLRWVAANVPVNNGYAAIQAIVQRH